MECINMELLLTLLFKALLFHTFSITGIFTSYVSHFSVIIIALFHTLSCATAAFWMCATTDAVALVGVVDSVIAVASLPPTLLIRSNITNGEHLLINSYEFTSSITMKKNMQSNNYIITINVKVSKIILLIKWE